MNIHLSDYAQNADIRIACDQSYVAPVRKKLRELPEGVYETDDGRLFTFEVEKTTCPACIVFACENDS